MTSSPGPIPAASRPRCRAEVPELTATARVPGTRAAQNSSSKAATWGPWAIMPVRMTAATASISSSPMSGRAGGMNGCVTVGPHGCGRAHRGIRGRGPGVLGQQGTVSLDVAAPRGRTHPRAFRGLAGCVIGGHEGYPGLADPPNAARGDAEDERVGGHVSGNHGTRADRCPRTDAHGRHADGARADGGTVLDGDADAFPVTRALQSAVGVDRAGAVVVREDGCGADEDAIGQGGGFVDEGVVLDLAARTYPNAFANVCPASDDRFFADTGVFANLGQVPHAGAGRDLRTGCHVGAGLDHGISLVLSCRHDHAHQVRPVR